MITSIVLLACSGGSTRTPPTSTGDRVLIGSLLGTQLRVEPDGIWVSAPGVDGDGVVARLDVLAGDATLADASVVVRAGAPGDVGGAFAVCDWGGGRAVAVGAPELGEAGRAWLVPDPPSGETALGSQAWVENRQDGARTGSALACAPDLLLVGAPGTTAAAAESGTIDAYAPDGAGLDKVANVDTAFGGAHLGDRTGVLPGVDWDGDGVEDLVVGASGSDRVHVLPGPLEGSVLASASGYALQGEDLGLAGYALAAGDLDGDGVLDLVIGEPGSGNGKGRVWVVRGPIDAGREGLLRNVAVSVAGVSQGAQAGFSVAVVGDVDADGRDDLLVGAPFAPGVGPEAGAAYLVLGSQLGDLDALEDEARIPTLDTAAALLLGEIALGRLGWSVAGGDVDDDGQIELLVSAPETDLDGVAGDGRVWSWSAAVRGTSYPEDAEASLVP